MKKKITITICFLYLTNLFSQSAVATFPFYEGFDYPLKAHLRPKDTPPNEILPERGLWFYDTNATTVSPVLVEQPWVNSKGLPACKGNAIQYKAGSNDPLIAFTKQGIESGTLYASFLFKINSWTTSNRGAFYETWVYNKVEEFIFSFLQDKGVWPELKFISTSHVFIKRDDVGDNFKIGVSEGFEVHKRIYHPVSFKLDEDILIVLKYKYDLNDGTTYLWINPTISTVEPVANLNTLTDVYSPKIKGSTPIMNTINKIKINRNSDSNTPEITFDELRVANTWREVVGITNKLSNSKK